MTGGTPVLRVNDNYNIKMDSHFHGNDIKKKWGGGNDPSEARLHGEGIKKSINDHREKRLCIHKLSLRFRDFSP